MDIMNNCFLAKKCQKSDNKRWVKPNQIKPKSLPVQTVVPQPWPSVSVPSAAAVAAVGGEDAAERQDIREKAIKIQKQSNLFF